MLRRNLSLLSLILLAGLAAPSPAKAAIGNGMEPIIVEPWLPVVAEAPAVAPIRQCRVTPRPILRAAQSGGKPRQRVVQRATCRA